MAITNNGLAKYVHCFTSTELKLVDDDDDVQHHSNSAYKTRCYKYETCMLTHHTADCNNCLCSVMDLVNISLPVSSEERLYCFHLSSRAAR